MRSILYVGLAMGIGVCPVFAQEYSDRPIEERILNSAPDTLYITESRTMLDEAVVTGTRTVTDLRLLPYTISRVERKDLERGLETNMLETVSLHTPGLYLTERGVMGFGVSGGGSGALSLRGLSASAGRMVVLLDGHPQYMGLMGHPISDAYLSQLAEQVEVLRGPASVLYGGNAMGGVLNIRTRENAKDGSNTLFNIGYGSYNTLETQMTSFAKRGRLTSVMSGAYNRTDGHRGNMDFKQYMGYAKLGYLINNHWRTSGDLNVMRFDAENPGTKDALLTDAEQDITRGATSLSLSNSYAKTNGALTAFYNWGRHQINDGYNAEKRGPREYLFHSRDYMSGVSVFQSYHSPYFLQGTNILTLGADYLYYGGRAWNNYVSATPAHEMGSNEDLVHKNEQEMAAYLNMRQHIKRIMTIDLGVRYNHHSEVGGEFIPQAGVGLHLPKHIELKASASKGFRNPTLKEMYLFASQNPDLKSERIWNYELQFMQRLLEKRLRYGITAYIIDGDDMIVAEYNPALGHALNVNTGEIRNKGVEAEVAYRIAKHWQANANYGYLDMDELIIAAPEHNLHLGADYLSEKLEVGADLQWIGGLCTSVANKTMEDYVLVGLRAQYKATGWLTIWAKGNNLLNQKYEINEGFEMPGATVKGGVKIRF